MSKAITGAAMLGAVAGEMALGLATGGTGLAMAMLSNHVIMGLLVGGLSMEAGAIADALMQNRGVGITTRQAAAFRQITRGERRVPGVEIYRSTTGSEHDQFNYVIVLAGHVVDSIPNLYLDGRQVYWEVGSAGNSTRNGVNFGGSAGGGQHLGPNGVYYDFDTLVYAEARYGDQAEGDVISGLTANDPNWVANSEGAPWVGGCTYIYLKVEYDTAMFPAEPEIRVTLRGKNDIYDPRTGTKGYTSNWALHVADAFTDPVWGLGDPTVNQDQLIAAANVCDEQIALAAGGTESQFCLHWFYDTSTSPGDVIAQMMPAAQGSFSRIGGEWYIWPAYWQGPSFTVDQDALCGPISWTPNRKFGELINRVNGTYIAPNYPYNDVGDLYDSNGYYNGETQNNFPFAFQPTNFPQYAADVLHGYAADQYLEEDSGVTGEWSAAITYGAGIVVIYNGVIYQSLAAANIGNEPDEEDSEFWVAYNLQLPAELTLSTVLSVAQSQRLAKIKLMRNRQQGSGTFPMFLSAFEMQEKDVMQFTLAEQGWTNKLLEVKQMRFTVNQQKDQHAYSIYLVYALIETDPSVYEWSTEEELTVYDVPALPGRASYTPVAPTNMTLTSSAATAVKGADGVVTPRVEIGWDAPLDIQVTQIQVQYAPTGSGAWIDAGMVDVGLFQSFVSGVVAGQAYDFRIRSIRSSGATSPWVEVDDYTVSETLSTVTCSGLSPNTPFNVNDDATVDSVVDADGTTADIRVYGPSGVGSAWDYYNGQGSATYPAATITGLAFATLYMVCYDTINEEFIATTDYNDTLPDSYIYLGSMTSVSSGGTGGTSGGGLGVGGTPSRPIPILPDTPS